MTQDLFNQSFFNTTSENGTELEKKQDLVAKQNDIILKEIRKSPEKEFTGSDIQTATGYLITSCRRSLHTLCNNFLIERTGKRWNPNTQANEFTYKLK